MIMAKKNINNRRKVALENLKKAMFVEKNGRSEQEWKKKVEYDISVLEKRIQ